MTGTSSVVLNAVLLVCPDRVSYLAVAIAPRRPPHYAFALANNLEWGKGNWIGGCSKDDEFAVPTKP